MLYITGKSRITMQKGVVDVRWKKCGIQHSESLPVGVLLALTGGFLDAYTYISRGGVFANAQTGNMVLLGIKLSQGAWRQAAFYFVPMVAFAAGVLLAELIQKKYKRSPGLHWRQRTVLIEAAILLLAGFVPAGRLDSAVNVAISFVCAMQVESFRKIHGLSYATTMCTGNLRSGTEKLFQYWKSGEKTQLWNSIKYYGIITVFIAGAFLGCLATNAFSEKAVWSACVFLLATFFLMHQETTRKDCADRPGKDPIG